VIAHGAWVSKTRCITPKGFEVVGVRATSHLYYRGSNFYLREIYAGCRVSLFENLEGITELHYSKLHLGHLEFSSR
jgi:hypothetical protein